MHFMFVFHTIHSSTRDFKDSLCNVVDKISVDILTRFYNCGIWQGRIVATTEFNYLLRHRDYMNFGLLWQRNVASFGPNNRHGWHLPSSLIIDRVRVQELWTYTSGKKSKTLKYSISIIHGIKMKWSYHLVVHYGRNILYLLKQMVS